jgi:hypothetical protein
VIFHASLQCKCRSFLTGFLGKNKNINKYSFEPKIGGIIPF